MNMPVGRSGLCAAALTSLLVSSPARAQAPQPGDDPSPPTATADGDLARRIDELEVRLDAIAGGGEDSDAAELRALHEAADREIDSGGETSVTSEPGADSGLFKSGARALQALNPEISVTADALGSLYLNDDMYVAGEIGHEGHDHGGVERSGFAFRAFELAIQANLDPYSSTKLVFAMHGGSPELHEGYVAWTGIIPRTSLTVGKFNQQLGVINRWHEHAFDQLDRPLVHQKFLGHHGLVGTGVSLRTIIPPAWAHAQELTLEVTNGANEELFAGEFFSIPTVLGHMKNYWDLSDSTYFELGLTGLWGVNNRRGVVDETSGLVVDEPWRHTVLAATDLSLAWVPVGRAKYRGVTWRSELLYLRKQVDHEGEVESGDALAGFSYLDVRIGPRAFVGARFDVGQNFDLHSNSWFWQASPYMTFWQSEFVFLRLQYNATRESAGELAHAVFLQADWSAGPHKHDKY